MSDAPGERVRLERRPRKNLLLSAGIEGAGLKAPVRIRNLSETGAMLDGTVLPEAGAEITLRRLELEIRGLVVWRAAGRCGIKFDGGISVNDWIAGSHLPQQPLTGQARVDEIQAALRAGAELPDEQSAELVDTSNTNDLTKRVAEEVGHARRLLNAIGDELAEDHFVLQRHGSALQNLDLACQILLHLETIIGAADQSTAAEAVTLQELRTRLLRKSIF
jgi:hypothetical protein